MFLVYNLVVSISQPLDRLHLQAAAFSVSYI